MERGWKSSSSSAVISSPNCPRCGSSNTKFCYYNNYSLTQPRYFCKGCRRYWTKGGSLRNIPVGGGCRKNRRVKSIRLPTDAVPSVSVSCPTYRTIGHSYGNNVNSSNGCHNIDLELVYANFLNNQQPENKSAGFEVAEFDPSLELSSLMKTNLESSTVEVPAEENGLIGCPLSPENHLSNINDEIYFAGLESFDFDHNKHDDQEQLKSHDESSNYGILPPFPGDDLSFQEVLWPNSVSFVSHF